MQDMEGAAVGNGIMEDATVESDNFDNSMHEEEGSVLHAVEGPAAGYVNLDNSMHEEEGSGLHAVEGPAVGYGNLESTVADRDNLESIAATVNGFLEGAAADGSIIGNDMQELEGAAVDIFKKGDLISIAAAWNIWLERNAMIFRDQSTIEADLLNRIFKFERECKRLFCKPDVARSVRFVGWNPSVCQGFILHVDGSSMGNPGRMGFGAVIRDGDGFWLDGVSGFIGFGGNLEAELVAIHSGLNRALDIEISKISCYSDSLEALRLIKTNQLEYHLHAALILAIKEVADRFEECHFYHILREGNSVADNLARKGAASELFYTTWAFPPDDTNLLVQEDAAGTLYPRA